MTSIFILYPQNQYYLAHIYEQFLANEFITRKIKYNRFNIGNGIIYIRLINSLSKNQLKNILYDYKLKENYYLSVIQQVKKEIFVNLKFKATYELASFQSKDFQQLKKTLQNYPSQKQFENFAHNITALKNIWIIDENKEKIIRTGLAAIQQLKIQVPKKIKNVNMTEISYETSAQNLAEALVYAAISGKLNIKNYLWIGAPKQLILTLKTADNKKVQKLNGQIFKLGNLKYTSKELFLVDRIWQKLEWGKVLSARQINQYLKKVKKIKINILKYKINFELLK